MAGLGKFLKQAQKMQKQMEVVNAALAAKTVEVSRGGGAVTVVVSGQQELRSLKLDPEFLKEEASLIEETVLEAVREALAAAKKLNETEMAKITSGFQMPGLM